MTPLRKLKVLFVCVGNSCRSQMAEAFARSLGGDVIEAASAGIAPARRIASGTRDALREHGISMPGQFSKGLDEVYLGHYDLVINMSALDLPEHVEAPYRQWIIEDPIRKSHDVYTKVAEKVKTEVLALIEEVRRLREGWHVVRPAPGQPIQLPLAPPRPLYEDRSRAAASAAAANLATFYFPV
jgi:arsenate reductase